MGAGSKRRRARVESGGSVVERLVEILGSRLVAVIAGLSQTGTLHEWINVGPPQERLSVLRLALKIASAIEARFDAKTAQSWFQAANHRLLDETPALVLNSVLEADLDVVLENEKRVLDACRDFLER